jgi:uncharacterized membrane protein
MDQQMTSAKTETPGRQIAAPGETHLEAGTPSLAAIDGHPIHPALVPIPIGLLAGVVASDVAYVLSRDRFWARASTVLTAGGLLTGLAAAAFGATDLLGRSRIREHRAAWLHAAGNVGVMALSGLGLLLRSRDAEKAVVPAGLALSLVSGATLLVTGWLGGELVFRHRIGMAPHPPAG